MPGVLALLSTPWSRWRAQRAVRHEARAEQAWQRAHDALAQYPRDPALAWQGLRRELPRLRRSVTQERSRHLVGQWADQLTQGTEPCALAISKALRAFTGDNVGVHQRGWSLAQSPDHWMRAAQAGNWAALMAWSSSTHATRWIHINDEGEHALIYWARGVAERSRRHGGVDPHTLQGLPWLTTQCERLAVEVERHPWPSSETLGDLRVAPLVQLLALGVDSAWVNHLRTTVSPSWWGRTPIPAHALVQGHTLTWHLLQHAEVKDFEWLFNQTPRKEGYPLWRWVGAPHPAEEFKLLWGRPDILVAALRQQWIAPHDLSLATYTYETPPTHHMMMEAAHHPAGQDLAEELVRHGNWVKIGQTLAGLVDEVKTLRAALDEIPAAHVPAAHPRRPRV